MVLQKLKKGGFEAYVVGGCVRDMLLTRDSKDWDFTTNANPVQIQALFTDSFYDNQFGTVGVPIKQSRPKNDQTQAETTVFEITTFRSEYGYSDHRHPDKIVWGKTLEDDLQRRDFTINAMAFDGNLIIDPYNGQKDLNDRLIKAVRDPDLRFQEDALRMMRAVRLATQLMFIIEENTFSAIKKNALLLKNISTERVRDELIKILSSDHPADGIKILRNAGILSIILPDLEKCFSIDQKSPKRHHLYDVGTHLIMSLQYCPSKDPIVRLATLLHDVGKPATISKTADGVVTFYNHEIISTSIVRNFAYKYHFSKKDRERLIKLVRFHQFSVDERQTDTALRRLIRNVGVENLDDILALRTGDRLGGGARETSWRLELYKKRLIEVQKQPFTVADLKIDGFDVMKIYNINPGPAVGLVLNALFNEVVEGKTENKREILLQKLKDLQKHYKKE